LKDKKEEKKKESRKWHFRSLEY